MGPHIQGFVVYHKQSAVALLKCHSWASSVPFTDVLRLDKEERFLQLLKLLKVVNDFIRVDIVSICFRVLKIIDLGNLV